MMNTTTATTIARLKHSVSNLYRLADQTADPDDARALHLEADYISEQIDALELDALPGCDEIPADVAEPIAA